MYRTLRNFSVSFAHNSLFKRTCAILAVSTLLLSGCSTQETATVKASNILENVDVNLNSSAHVSKIHSTIVSVDGKSGASSSQEKDYTVRDVVNELPVRITTRYRTDQGSGDNLSDLEGYTGNVNIDISVENLTVKPHLLTYDVAGAQKSKNALVGAPMSVAASATFEGVQPQDILSEATLESGETNGIVSTSDTGNAVIQWGKILAGPSTGSSATFTVNLKTHDFKVPEFAVAAHPGLSTDLTSSSAVTSTFSQGSDSELELMQQTVEIVAEANQALADASTTISDVRDNLNSTSKSLEDSTVKELQQSSDHLSKRLGDLQEKMASLKSNLGESAAGSQNELIDQMQKTVDSLEKFLGQKGDKIPAPIIDSGTCNVKISQSENGSTVYSNMVQLSQVLGAYGQANIDCRDQMVSVMNSLLGPENPSPETCKDSTSASCSVYNSQIVTTASLLSSAADTKSLVEKLQPGSLSQINTDYGALQQSVENLQQQIDALKIPSTSPAQEPTLAPVPSRSASPSPSSEPSVTPSSNADHYQEILTYLDTIDQHIKTSSTDIQDLENLLKTIHDNAQSALNELNQNQNQNGSMLQQNQDLADELCSLVDDGSGKTGALSQDEVNRLRGYLTDTPCGQTPGPSATSSASSTATPTPLPTAEPSTATPTPSATTASAEPSAEISASATVIKTVADVKLKTPENYQTPMDQRLKNQVNLWSAVLEATDTTSDNSPAHQKLAEIKSDFTSVTDQTQKIRDLLNGTNTASPSASASAEPSPTASSPINTDAPAPVNEDTNIQAVKDAAPQLQENLRSLGTSLENMGDNQQKLNEAIAEITASAPAENADEINKILGEQARNVSAQRQNSTQTIDDLFSQQVTALTGTSESVSDNAGNLLKDQSDKLNQAAQQQAQAADERTRSALENIQQSHDSATQDVAAASTLLTGDLEKIMLDVGDNSVTGSGLLGSLLNNASNADNADYQLSLATQNAEKYSTLREGDMGAIRLKQAQYTACLQALEDLPAFHYQAPSGARMKTIYTFKIGGAENAK